MNSDLFQYVSLSEAAVQLDIHPFDVARYLAIQKGGMPVELRLNQQQITQRLLKGWDFRTGGGKTDYIKR